MSPLPSEVLADRFGDRVRSRVGLAGQHVVVVAPGDLREVALFLRDDPATRMDVLLDVVGVDRLGHPERTDQAPHRFEVVWVLRSLVHGHRLRVVVPVATEHIPLPSLHDLWHAADWLEREVWDLFGLRFEGHPNLRRILCHHEFTGHALRKDYPIQKRQRLSCPEAVILPDVPTAPGEGSP